MSVVTRFAPSPTGYLHIGGARTALFAWAYAKQQGGKFFLRIEDTDLARSDAAHSDAIIHAMEWLELSPDAPPVFQSANRALHQEKIQQLLQAKRAYYCYTTPEELEALRTAQIARGENPKYDRRWRDCDDAPPPGAAPVVRFKMPETGQTTFHDAVKGALTVATDTLDDFIIARADGTPTYNLAAVVDDIAMGVTHVIRGDDHVMNTYRQWHLFMALANQTPVFAHLPMILTAATNEQGQVQTDAHGGVRYVRMSKRHAAVDITQYRREGFLPQALCNYLARLSWAHGDAEVFARDFFAEHFSFAAVSQSPARFDWEKLKWLNRSYIQRLSWRQLCQQAGIEQTVGEEAVELIRQRAHTLKQIKQEAAYFTQRPTDFPAPTVNQEALQALYEALTDLPDWQAAAIKQCLRQQSAAHQLNFKQLGMPLRAALTGREESPDIAAIAAVLGQEESLQRLKKFLQMHKN